MAAASTGTQVGATPVVTSASGAESESEFTTDNPTEPASDPATVMVTDGPNFELIEATCGASDSPETGLQGGHYPGTVNCGLTLVADIPGGGSAQG